MSTRATAGFNVVIKLSSVHVVPHMIANRLTATEPAQVCSHMLIGKFCGHPQPYRNCLEKTNGDFSRAVPKKRRSAIDCIQTDGTGQRFPLFSITPTEIEINMKSFISSIALAGVVVAAPVFASGYGLAPKYASSDGAPASQRGQSAQTLAVERKAQTTQETEYNTTPDAKFAAGNKSARSTASNQF